MSTNLISFSTYNLCIEIYIEGGDISVLAYILLNTLSIGIQNSHTYIYLPTQVKIIKFISVNKHVRKYCIYK